MTDGTVSKPAGWPNGWGVSATLRDLPRGVLPTVATRNRIEYYRVRHQGWKGELVTAWKKLAHRDCFDRNPNRVVALRELGLSILWSTLYGLLWNLVAIVAIKRYLLWRLWRMVTRATGYVEQTLHWGIDFCRRGVAR